MASERINKISELLLEEIAERFNKESIHNQDIEFSESFMLKNEVQYLIYN